MKRPGCGADGTPPSSAAVKWEWSCTFPPHYAIMACTGTTPLFFFWHEHLKSMIKFNLSCAVVQILLITGPCIKSHFLMYSTHIGSFTLCQSVQNILKTNHIPGQINLQ